MEQTNQEQNIRESREVKLVTSEDTGESLKEKDTKKTSMWKWILLGFILILIFVFVFFFIFSKKGNVYEPKTSNETPLSSDKVANLQAKEICENSGGKWDSRICNMKGCEPEYFCNCKIKEEDRDENELVKQDYWFLLSIEEACRECQFDTDCGKNTCEMVGVECRQNTAVCEEGVCHTKRYFSLNDRISYSCEDNECVTTTKAESPDVSYYKNEELEIEFK